MLLPLTHIQQQQQSDCLVACAAMMLLYLQIPATYNRISRVLGSTSTGTPFPNLNRLNKLGLKSVVSENGSLPLLQEHLSSGLPIIIALRTWPLPYWNQEDTEHAVVLNGFDETNVYLYDPAFPIAPQVITYNEFLTAWADHDYQYAMIRFSEFGSEITT